MRGLCACVFSRAASSTRALSRLGLTTNATAARFVAFNKHKGVSSGVRPLLHNVTVTNGPTPIER